MEKLKQLQFHKESLEQTMCSRFIGEQTRKLIYKALERLNKEIKDLTNNHE